MLQATYINNIIPSHVLQNQSPYFHIFNAFLNLDDESAEYNQAKTQECWIQAMNNEMLAL